MGLCASAPKADRDPKPQSETTQSLPVDTKCSATEQSRPRVDNGVCSDSHTYTDVSNVKLTFLQGEQVVHSIHEEEHEAAPHNSEMCSPHTASEPTASEPAESPLLPLAQLKDSTNPPGASLAQFDPRAGDEDSSPTEPSSKDSEQNRERFQDPRQSHDASRSLISGADLVGDGLDSNFRETSTLKKVMVSGKMMLNQYMVIKTLGKGNFGTVRLCFNLNDKKLYAIKTLNKKTLTKNRGLKKRKDADPLADLKREVAIMKKLRHPNLVRLFEVIDDPLSTKLLMVMEHVQGGPIRSDKPGAPGCMAEQVVVHYFRDMCMGLDYLHFNQIVHADLKPENMLLSATGEVKITDFGCSRVLDEEGIVPSRATGTPMFHAPEMTTGQPYNAYMADVWALGVTLYAFIFGEMPFDGKSIAEIHYNIANKALEFSASYFVSDELKDLLLRMMEKDPAKRIRLPEIMAHSWVTQASGPLRCFFPTTLPRSLLGRLSLDSDLEAELP
uniref:Calcium/calmodulin-dependent protein kinase kinase n=1 Tax=Tetraselmis sp. GSL018 TaxID=582737 RepID=A0A061REP4_9CHLO